jgi:hypothetical protein
VHFHGCLRDVDGSGFIVTKSPHILPAPGMRSGTVLPLPQATTVIGSPSIEK